MHLPGMLQEHINLSSLDEFSRPDSKEATSEIVDVNGEEFPKAIRVMVPTLVQAREGG
jgi:hypothetical protein